MLAVLQAGRGACQPRLRVRGMDWFEEDAPVSTCDEELPRWPVLNTYIVGNRNILQCFHLDLYGNWGLPDQLGVLAVLLVRRPFLFLTVHRTVAGNLAPGTPVLRPGAATPITILPSHLAVFFALL